LKKNLGDKILFSDTDLLTTICYSEFLFNSHPENITKEIKNLNKFDLYLYLWNDVPFVDDETIMDKTKRSEFHNLLFEKFKYKNIFVIKVSDFKERFNKYVEIVDKFIGEIKN
jgi:HTH-type transcriptional repressor of NAD biosynthesis genes